ncbi:unnamed protein product [Ceratitis capitata]|uniref:(Mediterranean fruit fly) hypothetical protein n=1 Tax=Ceratitis capitata TaxID=7213 RepID=A0A811U7F0_CERCA|nr:unnamed protein product [Ceratitis capitata]
MSKLQILLSFCLTDRGSVKIGNNCPVAVQQLAEHTKYLGIFIFELLLLNHGFFNIFKNLRKKATQRWRAPLLLAGLVPNGILALHIRISSMLFANYMYL